MKYFYFFFLFSICFACKPRSHDGDMSSSSGNEGDTISEMIFADEDLLAEIDLNDVQLNADSLLRYLSKATEMRSKLEAKLKKLLPSQADSLYLEGDFWFSETQEYRKISELVTPVVSRWGLSGGEAATLQDLKVMELLKKEGLEPEYLGEGDAELRINAYHYYNIFKPYLSESMREFLKFSADNDHIIEMDAGLVVPLDELIEKCIRWEEFLNKYPDIEQRKIVVSQYGLYMTLVMFCTYDNTRAFNPQTNVIDEYVLDEINEAIKEHPDNQTTNILKRYVSELEKSDYKYSKELEDKIMDMGILREFDRANVYY